LMTRLVGISNESIKEAANLVLAGRLIAYPTDTVYGLGCNPFDADAVDRLIKAKERVKGSLPILVSSFKDARRLGEMNNVAAALASKFWPGPLTLVVVTKNVLPQIATGHSSTVGLRIPNHEMVRTLIRDSGGTLVGTSANISGNPSLRRAEEVFKELEGKVDLVLDGGPAHPGRESTVVRVLGDEVTVLRESAISRDDILKALPVTRVS
jgi:L-threonylcarbamoyladenylate synthase